MKYDDFCGKVEDLLQVHLGESVKLQRMKSKKGGIVDNETALQGKEKDFSSSSSLSFSFFFFWGGLFLCERSPFENGKKDFNSNHMT